MSAELKSYLVVLPRRRDEDEDIRLLQEATGFEVSNGGLRFFNSARFVAVFSEWLYATEVVIDKEADQKSSDGNS